MSLSVETQRVRSPDLLGVAPSSAGSGGAAAAVPTDSVVRVAQLAPTLAARGTAAAVSAPGGDSSDESVARAYQAQREAMRAADANRQEAEALYREQNERYLHDVMASYGVNDGPPPPTDADVSAGRNAQQLFVVRVIKRLDLDGNGKISVNELLSLDNDPNRFRDVPLDILLRAERSVMVVSPALRARRETIARSIVRKGGTATEDDVSAVIAELTKLPMRLLSQMKDGGLSVVVCRNAVTDYLPDWEGRATRGHQGDGWQKIPGALNGKEIIIATKADAARPGMRVVPKKGEGHGAYNVLFHEIGHAINLHLGPMVGRPRPGDTGVCSAFQPPEATPDRSTGTLDYEPAAVSSWSTAFLTARRADSNRMLPYYKQDGTGPGAGSDEEFAESFARFYAQDPTLQWNWPQTYAFWAGNPLAGRPLRAAAVAVASGCGPAVRAKTDVGPSAPAAPLKATGEDEAPVPSDSASISGDKADNAPAPGAASTPARAPVPAPSSAAAPAPAPTPGPTSSLTSPYRLPWEAIAAA